MAGKHSGDENVLLPLFETKEAKGRVIYRLFAGSIFVGICFILVYRATHIPGVGEVGRWVWMGLLVSELWFSFYWIITQSVRWNNTYRCTFKDRLLQRYGADELPGVDVFVCTADPTIEPPTLVINTVLSVMAYDYPAEKLSVYLSDDGGSDMTFYALFEASRFSKHWIPFCKKFKVEPRSPEAYFSGKSDPHHSDSFNRQEWVDIKRLYEEMKQRIEAVIELGKISEEIKREHKGFSEWNSSVTKRDHHTILQILIDGRDPKEVDKEGHALPSLIYLAREKRPNYSHNFKAGAINALIRASSKISNGLVILTVDCDMYSNDSEALKDALCFLMDEEHGHQIAYVQFPQNFNNITPNDIYCSAYKVVNEVELAGMDGYGGSIYGGTGCFHRRESLCGRKYSKGYRGEWNTTSDRKLKGSTRELEERSKVLANCAYEDNTQWGKEMGLKYGCPVEDVITGLAIQCRGWKSVYYNPERKGFLGVAPITLEQALVQFKRWSEGLFQIFISKYCPFLYGHKKIKLGHQMGYCVYCLWATTSFPTLFYLLVPPLYFFNGIPLFPKISSLWSLPFAYVFITKNICSLVEALLSGDSLKAWWNMQRMWVMRRTTSFLFSFIDTIVKRLGFSQTTFTITAKVADKDVSKRYEQEVIEFGSSPMFTIIATVALLNLVCLVGGVKPIIMDMEIRGIESLISQIILCVLVVALNLPVYEAIFFRKDKGCMPTSIIFTSVVLASLACLMPMY